MTLSVFMPFHNEEANIRASVETALTVLRDLPGIVRHEVIIVDDGSTDGTNGIARELVKQYPDTVRLVTHPVNQGYGAAVISGLKNARYDYVFFTDGDLQFDLRGIVRLLERVPEYRAVIGYRAPRVDPFHRRLNAWAWNRLVNMLFGLKVRDIDCAFKLFETRLVSGLPLQAKGAMISTELMVSLWRAGIPVKEVPVKHLPRRHGATSGNKPAVVLKAFRELADLYFAPQAPGSLPQKSTLR